MFRAALITLLASALAPLTPAQAPPATGRKRPVAAVKAPPRPPPPAAPAAVVKYPIESIQVTGNKQFAEASVIALIGLRTGELLEERRLEAARDSLLANGAFTSINFRYAPGIGKKGYAVTFEVTELEQLFEYRFDRLEADEAKLRAFIKEREPLFSTRIPGAEVVLARFRAAIADYLKSQNKPAEVAGHVASENGETFVVFSPPGQLPAVATITFTGNKVIASSQLQNIIHPIAVGSQFRESRFRELLENSVRPLYEARGRLRMKFTKVESKPSDGGVKGLAVTVTLDEGEVFAFGTVSITGVPGAESDLIKAAAIPETEVADLQMVAKAQDRIVRLMRSQSHMAAAVDPERRIVDAGRLCHLIFKVTPGPKYTMGRLIFQGLDLHGEHEMRRIWTMKSDAQFNGEYPDLFVTRVKEDKLFDELSNLRAVSTPNSQSLTVDVKLIFNERKPKILE